ncbi:MAG: hypothetical protein P4L84_26535 [Isosphaeraceae bacterium]|nr:hypothetical protein [Isosphaeraceae bacterium]
MMIERYGVLFWMAVAVLASRVLFELGRGLNALLQRTVALLTTLPGRPQVILVTPAASPTVAFSAQAPTPAQPFTAPAVPNLLETMSHDEMDRLLEKQG